MLLFLTTYNFNCNVDLPISGDLKFRLVWILNGQKEVGLQIVKIFKFGQMAAIFLKKHLKSGQKNMDLNGPVFDWFETGPFEI